MNRLYRTFPVMLVTLGLVLGGSLVHAAEVTHIAILVRDSLTSTTRTLQGTRKVIEQEHPEAVFHTFSVADETARRTALVDSVRQINPSLILTVGTSATQFAKEYFPDKPIVFSAVAQPVLSGLVTSLQKPASNVTGASLTIPFEVQFRYFREVLPKVKKIGVLYTDSTRSLVTQASVIASEAGLTLVPIRVNDITQLPQALDSLATVADGMWSVADPTLFDPRSTKYIIMSTIRKGIPLMGFSRHVVESGALFALDFDYKAIGLQAGSLACRILDGERPSDIPVTSADVIWFHYNAKTAEHIHVTVPEELVAIAKEVYR